MLGHRELSFADYFAIAKRRKWQILLSVVFVPPLVLAATYVIPPRFVSQTLVLVQQQKVPDDFVKPIVNEDLNARLAAMREQILSRSRLQPIIERLGLYSNHATMEGRLDAMRKSISVTPIESQMTHTNGLPGFFISVTSDNAHSAQEVCKEVTSMFLGENLRAREQSVQGTTDFLISQLEDAKRSLDEQDAKLAEFQKKYIGALPEQETSNLNMLTTLNTQLDATTQGISNMERDKMYLESMLAQQQPIAGTATAKGNISVQTAQAELQKAEAQAAELEARYTPDHPDVVKVRHQIEALRKQLAAASSQAAADSSKEAVTVPVADPEAQRQQAQLRSLDEGIREKRREQARIQKQMSIYQARVQSSPGIQEQYKQLTRDYQTALQFYNDLLSKRNRSEMAMDLERRQEGEQFLVMDPPNLPEKPIFPDRKKFGLGGLAGGLGVGLLLAAYFEYRDQGLRNERDVLALLELPTLVSVPQVAPDGSLDSRKRKIRVAHG